MIRRCPIAAVVLVSLWVAGCATPVSLDEPARVLPLPPAPVVVVPAPATPAPPVLVPAPLPPLPTAPGAQRVPDVVPGIPVTEPPMLTEQRWLDGWFAGTPVVIALQGDGALLVEVPMEFSFDSGDAAVKPPLAAVLDRVATSLLRQREAQLSLDTPGDAGAPTRLAYDRATSVRQYLASRGVDPQRVTEAPPGLGPAVQMRLRLPPPVTTMGVPERG